MLFAAYTYRMTNRRKRYDPKKQFAVSPQTCDKSRNQSHREDHPSGGPKPPVRTGDEFHYVFLLILVKIDRFWVPDSPGAFRAVFGPPRTESSRRPVAEDQETTSNTSQDTTTTTMMTTAMMIMTMVRTMMMATMTTQMNR